MYHRIIKFISLLLLASAGEIANEATSAMHEQVRLARGVILIAKKAMTDPNFAQTVLLITEYDDTGTVGVVLNRPLGKPATEALPQLEELDIDLSNLYSGGPVRLNSLRLLVQTDTGLGDDYHVFNNVFQIRDFLGIQSLFNRETDMLRVRLYAGYAGWFPGQLERELLRGDWHLSNADPNMVFTDDPETLWEELTGRLDMQWVNPDTGKILPRWATAEKSVSFPANNGVYSEATAPSHSKT